MNPPENRKFLSPIPSAPGMGGSGETGVAARDMIMAEIPRNTHDDESVRANEVRYLKQRNALITLTKETQRDPMELAEAFVHITETTARTLGVGRVSIWRHNEARSRIECLDLFELATASHSSGMELVASEYPAYFRGLETMELIAADNAVLDPHTSEFADGYLVPLGIGSMMDVPVRLASRVDHLLCCEHVGQPRRWTSDEKTFAVAVANLISLALESRERAMAQQEVLRSHQRFQSVAAATNDTIWDWDLQTDGFWWSDGLANLFGWSAGENQGNIRTWIRQIHPDDRNRVVAGIYASIERGEEHWTDEYRFVSNTGAVAQVLDRGKVIRDSSGIPLRMVGGMMDRTESRAAELELARSHRALKMLSSCNEMLVRASDEDELLAEACRIAVEIGGFRMAWVGYAMEDAGFRIVPMACAGYENGYLSEIDVSWDENRSSGVGPAGIAVRTGEIVVFEDLLGNPRFANWAESARQRGYRSVVSLPLRNEQRIFGVICLYATDLQPAGPDELKLLPQMANDLSFGIGNIRSRRERQRTEEVVVKVAQAVSSGTGTEFFDLLARNMVEALGAVGGWIGRHDAESERVETISFILHGRLMDNIFYDPRGTPCEQVVAGGYVACEHGLRIRYPDAGLLNDHGIEAYAGIPLFHQDGGVVGLMSVFFPSPMKETSLVGSTLRIFAARAAAEMDRRTADARIREQASLLDKAQDAILVRDLQHKITYWNKSAERLYGWTAAEAIGRCVSSLLYKDTQAFNKAHEQTMTDGEWVGEMNQIDKTGRELVIEGRWTLVCDDRGRPQSVFVINTDISEHRKLEQQFIRAQRLESIGTLAGGIAHDLNNILAPISMAVELLKMTERDARAVELLDTIAGSARRGANMVGQVLSFARGVEGVRVEIHPRDLITDIEGILRDTFPRNICLNLVADDDLWTIHGDPTQLHQVLLNLCVNSRDAIIGTGSITVSATNAVIDETFAAVNLEASDGPHVCICVEDDGEGIHEEIVDRIFDPFFTTKSVGKGTGLGLPTTLAIVKSHGGFIRVTSQPGEGTRFLVYLPARPDLVDAPAAGTRSLLPRGSGETILVVDDEELILTTAARTLEAFGYRTLVASNGAEALSIYGQDPTRVDCVLTDMMMPVMDGMETIVNLLAMAPELRVIATSGLREHTDTDALKSAYPVVFLPKPYSAEQLLQTLAQVLTAVRSEEPKA